MQQIANPIIAKMASLAAERGLSLTALSKAAGLGDTTLTKKAKEPYGSVHTRTINKVAALLGVSANVFLLADNDDAPTPALRGEVVAAKVRRPQTGLTRKDLPVRGTAAGSAVSGFEISPNIIEYVQRPPGLEGVADAYAIYVRNDSMLPKHKDGDLCFVHPYRPYTRGDSIIVQIQIHREAAVEAYIKEFVRATDDDIIAKQFNPDAQVIYKRTSVFAVHKVLTMKDLFGV